MAKEKKEPKPKIVEKAIVLPENLVKTNHEFLFIYDAQLCNPNGDPNNENKPRMDEEREINLVSDVRLKRYIRDYLQKYKDQYIYVTKLDGKSAMPKDILDDLKVKSEIKAILETEPFSCEKSSKELKSFLESKDLKELKTITKEQLNEFEAKMYFADTANIKEFYLNNLIDVRMFGATMAIEGDSKAFTGPIQINWGYSLNQVKIRNEGITTHFSSNDKAEQGSMGTDHRVNYSMIAFYGNIIAAKCKDTLLTEDDIDLFDEAIIKSIPLLSTRSKIGQYPRFYIRIEYNDGEYLNGDLRRLVKLELNEELKNQNKELTLSNIRDISEVELNTQKLQETIDRLKSTKIKGKDNGQEIELVKNIKFWQHDDLKTKEK